MSEAYIELVIAIEDHLRQAAANKILTRRDKETCVPSHSIADAIVHLIDEKLAEKR